MTNTINHSLKESIFPDELKQSQVIPVYKKLDNLLIYKQINNFMENKISKCVTGFRKSHGTHHSLIVKLEKWEKVLDKEEKVSFIFIDFSKAIDTINHGLLLAKVNS